MAFCPKCGKTINDGQVFCDVHRPMTLDVKPFNIIMCDCGRFFAHNHWFVPQDVEESILKVARDHIKQRASLELEEFALPEKRGKQNKGRIRASFEGEEFPLEFPVKNHRCEKCAHIKTHYFTAILQLRSPPAEVLPFIEEFLLPLVDKGVSINKVEETPRGPDLYLTHKSTARQLGEKLVRKFGGSLNLAEKHFSQDHMTSKVLYRLNVLVEFPLFTKNDVVLLDDNVVLVTGLGKQCTGRDLLHNKKVVFTAGSGEVLLKKEDASVASVYPDVAVYHPVSFQIVKVANHPLLIKEFKANDPVKIVIVKNSVYIV
jgi:NMD protein affecting ribosome stability and mRNA decay